jgi:plastocyanin
LAVLDTLLFINNTNYQDIQRLVFTTPRPNVAQKDFLIPRAVGTRWEYDYTLSAVTGLGLPNQPRVAREVRGTLALVVERVIPTKDGDSAVGMATLTATENARTFIGGALQSTSASVISRSAPFLIQSFPEQTGVRISVDGFASIVRLLPKTVDVTVGETISFLWATQGGTVQYTNGRGVVNARFSQTANPSDQLTVEINLKSFSGR